MASSRLERIGTIFSRVEGLIRSGAMHPNDRPLWWDIYKAFPPAREPLFARPVPNMTLKKIFYSEDVIRAKFHKSDESIGCVDLNEKGKLSNAQKLIQIHKNIQEESTDNQKDFYSLSLEVLKEEIGTQREEYETKKDFVRKRADITKTPINEEKQAIDIKNLFE